MLVAVGGGSADDEGGGIVFSTVRFDGTPGSVISLDAAVALLDEYELAEPGPSADMQRRSAKEAAKRKELERRAAEEEGARLFEADLEALR